MASELDVATGAAVEAAKPTQADVRSAFRGKVVDHADGSYTVDIHDRRDAMKLVEMKRPWARKAADVGRSLSDQVPTVALNGPHGMERLPAKSEARLYAAGYRAVRAHGQYKLDPAMRRFFPCGHYTERASQQDCPWGCCDE